MPNRVFGLAEAISESAAARKGGRQSTLNCGGDRVASQKRSADSLSNPVIGKAARSFKIM
jgi:hypothetical protein